MFRPTSTMTKKTSCQVCLRKLPAAVCFKGRSPVAVYCERRMIATTEKHVTEGQKVTNTPHQALNTPLVNCTKYRVNDPYSSGTRYSTTQSITCTCITHLRTIYVTLLKNAFHGARTRWSCCTGLPTALTSIQLRICGHDWSEH